MPLWEITTEKVQPDSVGSFKPIKVLFDFDALTTFVCSASDGGLLLAHFCDEEDGERRFIVVPTTERLVHRLDRGEIPIRAALNQARVWYVDFGRGGKPLRAYTATFEDIPPDCLPTPGATFLADAASD